jgi:hypothetical protein
MASIAIVRFSTNFKNAEASVGRWNEVCMNPKRFTVASNWIHRMDSEHEDKTGIEQLDEDVQRLARAATAKW